MNRKPVKLGRIRFGWPSMLLILRWFSAREAGQDPPQSGNARANDRFEIADSENLSGRPRAGRAATGDGFQIERLEESRIEAEDLKTQRSERSQEVVENKGKCFSHRERSQEVYENTGLIFVKPKGS